MWLKAMKIVGTVVVDTLLSSENDEERKASFMSEHDDGLGNINHYGDSYSQQEASDAYD
ncbi:hypothetical protein [Shewanella chilikensis]|uniref:hypothetical protein n=2 Tax=Shewanellaceae TaxID=267890 RepID=UPI00399A69D1